MQAGPGYLFGYVRPEEAQLLIDDIEGNGQLEETCTS
jgi:hypothetical protein